MQKSDLLFAYNSILNSLSRHGTVVCDSGLYVPTNKTGIIVIFTHNFHALGMSANTALAANFPTFYWWQCTGQAGTRLELIILKTSLRYTQIERCNSNHAHLSACLKPCARRSTVMQSTCKPRC